MPSDTLPSDHAREGIHEQINIDGVSFEMDVGPITNRNVIASGDLKVFKAIDLGDCTAIGFLDHCLNQDCAIIQSY